MDPVRSRAPGGNLGKCHRARAHAGRHGRPHLVEVANQVIALVERRHFNFATVALDPFAARQLGAVGPRALLCLWHGAEPGAVPDEKA